MTAFGYASSTSVQPTGTIAFHLSTDTPGAATLTVKQWGGSPSATFTVDLATQPVPATNAWEGYQWPESYSFRVPIDWPSGLYVLTDANDGELCVFVVTPTTPGITSTILLKVAFLTPQAYNNAGGKSLYAFNSSPSNAEADRATQVSFDRLLYPINAFWEKYLIDWLAGEAKAVEVCSDIDLHTDPSLLANYDCLVCAGHDEYWTKEIRDQTEQFVANGGNLVVLSGNTCYRQVRLEQENRMLVFYKYAAHDPEPDNQRTTVAWADPPVNRPQNQFLGVGWGYGAFSTGVPIPYTIRFPSHWVFAGISPPPDHTSNFLNYETDAAAFVEEGEGYPRVTGEEGTPLSFIVLASADLRGTTGGKPGMATMGLYSRNGTVFACGTTNWPKALASDAVIGAVTQNVLNRLGERHPRDWEDIGQAINGCALTALRDRLFISTTDNRLWRRYPVGADVPWRPIGHANSVIALAANGDTLFCVTDDNQLWWREPVESDVNWNPIGLGPQAGTRAIAAADGMLYSVDSSGVLQWRPATRSASAWTPVASFTQRDTTIKAITSYRDILLASTADDRLLRSSSDWIGESVGWAQIHHCNSSVGLAVVEGMLFVATSENRLWRLDLYGLRQP